MGRVQIAKLVTQGGENPHPEYIVVNPQQVATEVYTPGMPAGMVVPLNGYDTTSYPLPIDSDYIIGPFPNKYYMAYNTFDQLGITEYNGNYAFHIKFKLTSTPSALRDICGINGLVTPDIDVDRKVKLWQSSGSQYMWESTALTVGEWYYLIAGYDLSEQTCYYSLFDSNEHILDTGSFADSRSPSLSSSVTVGWGNFPAGLTGTYGESSRPFDCGVIDLKESYFMVNGVQKQYCTPGTPDEIYYSDIRSVLDTDSDTDTDIDSDSDTDTDDDVPDINDTDSDYV